MKLKNFFTGRTIMAGGLLVIVALIALFYAFNNYIYEKEQGYAAKDYKNAEYVLDGTRVRLVNGKAETPAAPGSASKVTTTYFGNEITADLNDDGRQDVVFLLTQTTGGTGTFYYVVAALNTSRGYVGSQGLLLGDRIAPQTTEKGKGKIIVVNYAERTSEDHFLANPTLNRSIWLLLDPQTMQFGEVVQNFEGESVVGGKDN